MLYVYYIVFSPLKIKFPATTKYLTPFTPPVIPLPFLLSQGGWWYLLNAPVLHNLQEQQVTDLLVGSAACYPDLLQEYLLARMTPEDANNTAAGWG